MKLLAAFVFGILLGMGILAGALYLIEPLPYEEHY